MTVYIVQEVCQVFLFHVILVKLCRLRQELPTSTPHFQSAECNSVATVHLDSGLMLLYQAIQLRATRARNKPMQQTDTQYKKHMPEGTQTHVPRHPCLELIFMNYKVIETLLQPLLPH